MAVKVSVGPGIKAILIAMITLAMVLVAVRWNRVIAPQRATAPVGALGAGAFPAATGDAAVVPAAVPAAGADLRRPLKVAINTWGGYAGGILANRGQLAPSAQSAFRAQFGIDVELVLIDDFAASRAAFRTGGDSGGVDVMWATVDSFALEYPSLERDYHPVAFMQFDFSRGGDAIAATREIRNAADLRGKRVAYTPATPSHYFLLYVLAQAGLTPDQIVKVETASAPEAASAFRAGTVDAAVSWAPDVFNAAAARSGGHILSSTREANRLIADVFYTRRDFLAAHLRIDDEVAVRQAQLETIRETVSMLREESTAPRDPARFRIEVDSFLTELDAAAAHAGELATMEEQISLDEEVRTRFSS